MKEYKQTELAYLAGMIDGDGCIALYHRIKKGYNEFNFKVCVQMANEEVPKWLHEIFGGRIYLPKPSPRSWAYNRQWTWDVNGREAINLLEQAKDFFVLKKPQVLLAIEYGKTIQNSIHKTDGTGTFGKMPEEILKLKIDICKRYREANAIGRAKRALLRKAG
jgi:hypothetical protein